VKYLLRCSIAISLPKTHLVITVLHGIALLVLAFNDKTGLERAVLARAINMAEIVSMKDAHRK
jgi:hypothetical protein